MTKERYKELEHLYVFYREGMSHDELLEFKNYLDDGYAPEEYIDRWETDVNQRVERIKRLRSRKESELQEWERMALEYKRLTDHWLELGATHRAVGKVITKWEYKGQKFFTWFSGTHTTEILPKAKEADKKLKELIKVSTQ